MVQNRKINVENYMKNIFIMLLLFFNPFSLVTMEKEQVIQYPTLKTIKEEKAQDPIAAQIPIKPKEFYKLVIETVGSIENAKKYYIQKQLLNELTLLIWNESILERSPKRKKELLSIAKGNFLKLAGKNGLSNYFLALMALQENDPKWAEQNFIRSIQLPNEIEQNYLGDAYFRLGKLLVKTKPEEAKKWWQEGVQKTKNINAAISLSKLLSDKGELDEARKILLQVHNLKDPRVYFNLGAIAERQKNIPEAIKNYALAGKLNYEDAKKRLQVLLKAPGAQESIIDKPNIFGFTRLHIAAEKGDLDAVEKLIAAGANVNSTNKNGETPVYIASKTGHEKVVEKLISSGADVNQITQYSVTPLMIASGHGYDKIVEKLIAGGAIINKSAISGLTALHLASMKGQEKAVEKLIVSGADVNKVDNSGITPLYLAASHGHDKLVKLLIVVGASVNKGDTKTNTTPLMVASLKGDIDVVRQLLQAHADVNLKNTSNTDAVGYTLASDSPNKNAILKLLHDAGARKL